MTTTPSRAPEPPADPVVVRRATPADAATVHTLVREIAAHEDSLDHVRVTAARWTELLERDDVVVLLAERAGRALGYTSAVRRLHLWTGGDVLAVDDVYVRPGERDAGLGRRLLTAMAGLADPDGLTLTWGVEPDNAAAQRFYARLGATLRAKVLAGWTPAAYRRCLATPAAVTR
ncbi:GNAT family N-acetyltransferase [Georgenia thermotolerans]|uniref:GNAT family N-acetyltransferase n=1 Tax=Georgenia thermotolerans TaxID=527326 RepID=A0A7J5UU67_9MICO|nr:GNAT family N-acetyltransferase [Georgenia thermotolerans]KAE8765818.1 GNAT family N-acetyltransferase [Georgenia thermotolerans]